jgi:hypothetical protein
VVETRLAAAISATAAGTAPSQLTSDVDIVIVTAPTGEISLHEEVRLVKPALLYADHVTVFSPVAALLQSAAAVGLNPDLLLALVREVGHLFTDEIAGNLATYDDLVARKHKTRKEMQTIIGLRKILIEGGRELVAVVDGMVEKAGGMELIPAIQAGLLTFDPLVREEEVDVSDDDLVFHAFIARLREVLVARHAYPLFDKQVGGLVHAAAAESAFELGRVPTRRGKQVSAAAHFMQWLPAFPEATVQEIIGIRDELRDPLVRFRAAVIDMESTIECAAHDPDFQAEVEEIFHVRVAPALLEIRERVEDNSSIRALAEVAITDGKGILTAAMTFGMTAHADLSHLVAAALDVTIPVGVAVGRAALAQKKVAREIERDHQLFMLYKTNALLDA